MQSSKADIKSNLKAGSTRIRRQYRLLSAESKVFPRTSCSCLPIRSESMIYTSRRTPNSKSSTRRTSKEGRIILATSRVSIAIKTKLSTSTMARPLSMGPTSRMAARAWTQRASRATSRRPRSGSPITTLSTTVALKRIETRARALPKTEKAAGPAIRSAQAPSSLAIVCSIH